MLDRQPDHPIDPMFFQRWSPRAFDGQPMPEADLLSLLEAARWAPSAYNIQPWRFLYARREDTHWADFVSLLVPFNIAWAQQASALIFVLSDSLMDGKADEAPTPSRWHSFDTGAAWAQLALQAIRLGYHTRGMGGVDLERARERLRVPPRYRIEAAIAIGRRADAARLPAALRRSEGPTPRRPLHEFAFAGAFPDPQT